MKINLSQFAGFCDGVKRAYDMVMELDMAKVKKPVFVLGSLVHNPEVNRKIEEKGISEIKKEKLIASKKGEIGTLIITAHGVGPDIYKMAKERNVDIIDTTCPKVIKVQRLAQHFKKKGKKIVLVGDRDHKEVRGINDWGGGDSFIVSELKDLDGLKVAAGEKIVVLSQTTQSEDFCTEVAQRILEKFPEVRVESTICHTTHERQDEIKKMAKENEVVFIIGSRSSANSTRLYEIAHTLNPCSYFIENEDEIEECWLKGISNVGVSAGASTPPWVIKRVVRQLEQI